MTEAWIRDHAEITALRAEIERLTADLAAMSNAYAEISRIVGRQGTEKESLADQVRAEIERLRAALREAAIFMETAAPFLPDDVTVRHSFNNGETLQTRPLSVVLRACAKDARRALEGK